MKSKPNIISIWQRALKIGTSLLMCFCLMFLTGVNFIVFPQQAVASTAASTNSKEKDPSAPVEEKASSNTSVSIQEEYLHELHSLDEFAATEKLLQHKQFPVEKLQKVHFELISPPPEA